VVLTHLPLQAKAAPATAVPIAAGETRKAGAFLNKAAYSAHTKMNQHLTMQTVVLKGTCVYMSKTIICQNIFIVASKYDKVQHVSNY
jgi:hypothetical protein